MSTLSPSPPHVQVWELALANGRGSDVYEIVGVAAKDGGSGGRSKDSGSGSSAPHRAAFEVERRLRAELLAKEASPTTEAQAVVVRNFYSRRVWHCSFVLCFWYCSVCLVFCSGKYLFAPSLSSLILY